MPRTNPPYPPAFRAEAVRLVLSGGKCIPIIANGRPLGSIGVSDQALRGWVKQAAIDGGERDGLTTQEREELRGSPPGSMRRENRILEEERDILKKAAAFFASASSPPRRPAARAVPDRCAGPCSSARHSRP
ncbi:MAG: transposase [Chloroflexota bacterium]|nr:transposase [Chloroflexota bacterium]MDQ6908047.1 transposase [Chloroflexota bacterium]